MENTRSTRSIRGVAACALVIALTTGTTTARAQTVTPSPGTTPAASAAAPVAAPPTADTTTVSSSPNRAIIATGILGFLFAYIPSIIVASKSDVTADHRLFIPVAGPWADLADRPLCGPGVGSVPCKHEAASSVLLIVDGLFQAWGIGAAITGIFAKEHTTTTTTPPPRASVRFAPAHVGATGYGIGAFGSF